MHACQIYFSLLFILVLTPISEVLSNDGHCDATHLVCRQDWVTTRPERALQRWLDKLKRNPACYLTRNSGEVGTIDNPLGGGKPDGQSVEHWYGGVDMVGRFEGEGILDLRSCEGESGCEEGLERVEGVWAEGKLEGPAVMFVMGEHTEVVFMVGGVKHGMGLVYLDRKRKYLAKVTLYKNGERVGPEWDFTMGQGLDVSTHLQPITRTVGTLNPTSHWGGGALYNNTVWLYPGYMIGMTGQWLEGVMVEGSESELARVRCRDGFMEAVTRRTSSSSQSFDPPTRESICSDPQKLVNKLG